MENWGIGYFYLLWRLYCSNSNVLNFYHLLV